MKKYKVYEYDYMLTKMENGNTVKQELDFERAFKQELDFERAFKQEYSFLHYDLSELLHTRMVFKTLDLTEDDIQKRISDHFVFFPMSRKYTAKQILRYIDLGFKPLFMKSKDFNELKKDIG